MVLIGHFQNTSELDPAMIGGLILLAEMALHHRADFQRPDLSFMEILASYVSTLVSSSLMFQKMNHERDIAEKMAKFMAGREVRMRELKDKLEKAGGL